MWYINAVQFSAIVLAHTIAFREVKNSGMYQNFQYMIWREAENIVCSKKHDKSMLPSTSNEGWFNIQHYDIVW